MSMHFFVRFEPKAGREEEFRDELRQMSEPTRAEPGCLSVRYFETLREPFVFTIHSEWVDEAAFELHAGLPHTLQFLKSAEELLTHPVQGIRTHEIIPY